MKNVVEKMVGVFGEVFDGGEATLGVRAPGRVNLIGEHTDYNDGFVLPVALDHAVYVVGRAAEGSASRLHSMNFGGFADFDTGEKFEGKKPVGWGLYAEGVARVLCERTGSAPRGIEAVVWGDVPLGSGLSSSAAFEVAVGYFLLQANGVDVELPELARFCQEAENRFAGVQCGIMDQFISCVGRRGNAVFLDCRSLGYDYVPLPEGSHELMVLNTGVARGLAGSAYNDRRAACEAGVAAIRGVREDVRALRDVSAEEFVEYAGLMSADVAAKCGHVVTENERVARSVELLRKGDVSGFGKLMSESHVSLRDGYGVSCRELDVLHDAAAGMDGVAGERMTGAGFGGCAVAIVERGAADAVEEELKKIYVEKTGLELVVYRSGAREGVGRVEV